MIAYTICVSLWLGFTALALISPYVSVLNSAGSYGKLDKATVKTSTNQNVNQSTVRSKFESIFLHPSLYFNNGKGFTTWYLTSAIMNGIMVILIAQWLAQSTMPKPIQWFLSIDPSVDQSKLAQLKPSSSLLIVQMMCTFQALRRLMECIFVHRFSSSSQHIILTIIGFSFYIGVAFTPLIDCLNQLNNTRTDESGYWMIQLIGSIGLFIFGSHWQHRAHVQLAELRDNKSNNQTNNQTNNRTSDRVYVIPSVGSFKSICCPHYTAECVIYLAYAVLRPSFAQSLVLVWVIANLALTARKTQVWYMAMAKQSKARVAPYAMIPYIW